MYGIAAAGRPLIAVTSKDGEIARLVRAFDCGVVVEPGNADEMATAIVRLSNGHALRADMGRRARAMLDAEFTRRRAFERWKNVINAIARTSAQLIALPFLGHEQHSKYGSAD